MTKSEKLFEASLLGMIFLLSFELSSGSSFYTSYVLLLATVLSFMYVVIKNIKSESIRFIDKITTLDFPSKGIVTFLCLYLFIDAINFLKSDYKNLAIGKYKVVLLMIFLSVAIFVYAKDRKKEFNIHLSLGICSVFICIVSFINYFIVTLYPIYYTLRLSLRSDYNMYSVAILTGIICLFYYSKVYNIKKWLLYYVSIPLCFSCVILSGSRRGFLFLLTIGIIFFISDIFPVNDFKIDEFLKIVLKKLCVYLIIIAEIVVIVFLTEKGLNSLYKDYGSFINSQNEIVKIENETSYANRLDTISEGSFLTKRMAIWKEAIGEIKTFDTTALLLGKGNGYDIYIYSESTDEELNNLYDMEKNKFNLSPHNFILSDILCGGLLKAGTSLVLWIFIGIKLIKLILTEKMLSFLYILPLGMVFANSFISGRYGFIYDKYLYIFLILLLLTKNRKNIDFI